MEKPTVEMPLAHKLKTYLEPLIRTKGIVLPSKFFGKNGYETSLCEYLGFGRTTEVGANRYWDATLGNLKIEIKKTHASEFRCNIVRYAEHLLAQNGHKDGIHYPEHARSSTVMMFIQTKIYNEKSYVSKLYVLDTESLLPIFKQTEATARALVDEYNDMHTRRHGL